MKLDVILSPGEIAPGGAAGRVVLVIDVLRASTSIAVALANDAKAVIPVETADEAITRAKQFERSQVLLAGERRLHPIPGFDLGNSPGEFSSTTVRGKTILLTTTNGTKALLNLQGAVDIVIGSYVNLSATAAMLRAAARGGDLAIVCSGNEGHFSLEDAACAGRFVRAIKGRGTSIEINDAASACALIDKRYGESIAKVFTESSHGRALIEAGFGADLVACAAMDSHPVVAIYRERQITRLGPDRPA